MTTKTMDPPSKTDPHYQPTKAEMKADISVKDATPERLAQAIFKGTGKPTH